MKPIEKDELFNHVSEFLKAKGIEFKEGAYAQGIQKSCGFLTDAINLGQQGIRQAKAQINKNLDRMRQVIHEKTAPNPSARSPSQSTSAGPKGPAPKSAKNKKPRAGQTRSKPGRRSRRPKSKR